MKISYHQYELIPQSSLNVQAAALPRKGALIEVAWPDGAIGYADLHPWPELGDFPLAKQLADLHLGKISNQLEQSIWMAKRDARARCRGQKLWETATIMKNNYLAPDFSLVSEDHLERVKARGFSTIKMKAGRDLSGELQFAAKILKSGNFMLRIDFNSSADWSTFEKFITSMDRNLLERLDYVEDPFPFDEAAYNEARSLCRIALDREQKSLNKKKSPPCDVLILKPAVQDVDLLVDFAVQWKKQVVVTSYMDHAVGLVHAALIAGDLKMKHPNVLHGTMGCLTNHLFKEDDFFKEVLTTGPSIRVVLGTGIGFDRLFEKLSWTQAKVV